MSKVSFIHIRATDSNGKVLNYGGSTIAFRETSDGVEFAQSWCSPRDNFSRAVGRVKAEGRLNSSSYCTPVDMSFEQFRQSVYNRTYNLV